MAVVMAISMLSLAGIPPTAGFFGKYMLFTTALSNGHAWLVVLAVISSLIGVYYYFKVIIAMFYGESVAPETMIITRSQSAILIILAALTIIIGILPGIFAELI
jgi:NADH-quinone oxidoreductase subunit N